MESPQSRTFAQFGGFLLLVSLAVPYYALSFAGFGSHGFRLWTLDKGAFVMVAAFGLLALAQVKMSARDTMALIYLIIGGLFTAVLVYKFWIHPPGSEKIGDFGGLAGSGGTTATVNGKPVASFSANELLKAMGIELKPTYGAWMAMLGSAFFTVGAFIEFREAGNAPAAMPMQPQPGTVPQPASPAQRYQAPAPAGQQYAAPDPFAAPAVAQAAPRTVAPDPFAVPQQAPAPEPQRWASPARVQPAAPPQQYPPQAPPAA